MLFLLIGVLILTGTGLLCFGRKRLLKVVGWFLLATAAGIAVFLYYAVLDAL
jgi:hypothetical protein